MKKIIALTLALLMSLSCFSLISFAEETETTEHLTEVPEGYIGIYTPDDLDNIKLDLSGKYILMNDITFEDSDYINGGSFYNSGKGWEPIGTYSNKFRGILDGNGYAVRNLYINDSSCDYIGLFGYVLSGTIKNLILINAKIIGKMYVGGIAGYFSGTSVIFNCLVDGLVSGDSYVGGFCGYQGIPDSVTENCYNIISTSINTSTVNGNNYVGGFTGKMESSHTTYDYQRRAYSKISKIEYCINQGNISAADDHAGGFCGLGSGSYFQYRGEHFCAEVINSYNIGVISAPYYAGGIGGYSARELLIESCYSVGSFEPSKNFDGIAVNSLRSGFLYYLDESGSEIPSEIGTPKSTDQMKKQTTYEGWDFNTIWTMDGRADYPYPELRDVPLVLPEDLTHKHEYTSEVTKEATHLEEGETTYTCECGDSYTEAIANLEGHTYTSEVTKEATHFEEGETTYTCACGDSYTEAISKLTGHTYKEVVTEPTCTAKGYTTYTCACGDSYVSDYVGVSEHSYFSTITTPSTHLTEGVKTYTCSDCGNGYTEKIAKTPQHTYTTSKVIKPTCTDKGYTSHYCECGDSYNDNYTSATGHKYNGQTCANCGKKCSCNCHKSGFMGFIWKIILFFNKLFKTNKTCACGVDHY